MGMPFLAVKLERRLLFLLEHLSCKKKLPPLDVKEVNKKCSLGLEAQAYNPSYLRGQGRKIANLRPAWATEP